MGLDYTKRRKKIFERENEASRAALCDLGNGVLNDKYGICLLCSNKFNLEGGKVKCHINPHHRFVYDLYQHMVDSNTSYEEIAF